jgi:hypothetical protein
MRQLLFHSRSGVGVGVTNYSGVVSGVGTGVGANNFSEVDLGVDFLFFYFFLLLCYTPAGHPLLRVCILLRGKKPKVNHNISYFGS